MNTENFASITLSEKIIEHNVETLVRIFNTCFEQNENTILRAGGSEPIYLPAGHEDDRAIIVSTHDYFSSALHEISHWCIAGTERRKRVDYGYWYEPDGRNEQQQVEFEKVEVKPQALEWLFTHACGLRFRISADNLENPNVQASQRFKQNIANQVLEYLTQGLTGRAKIFIEALLAHYFPEGSEFNPSEFSIDKL